MTAKLVSPTTPMKELEALRAHLEARAEIFPDARTAAEAVAEVIRLRRRLGEGLAAGHRRITLCGSQRFAAAFDAVCGRLTLAEDAMVHTAPKIALFVEVGPRDKDRLDLLWFAMIESSDEVFVVDCAIDGGEPYIGRSTAEEIAFARERGIPVRFLSEELAKLKEGSDG